MKEVMLIDLWTRRARREQDIVFANAEWLIVDHCENLPGSVEARAAAMGISGPE